MKLKKSCPGINKENKKYLQLQKKKSRKASAFRKGSLKITARKCATLNLTLTAEAAATTVAATSVVNLAIYPTSLAVCNIFPVRKLHTIQLFYIIQHFFALKFWQHWQQQQQQQQLRQRRHFVFIVLPLSAYLTLFWLL